MSNDARQDPLFNDAVEIMFSAGRVSVSLLQRRLAIGYTRASRLLEVMHLDGIVAEFTPGMQFMPPLISLEEWTRRRVNATGRPACTNCAGPVAAEFHLPNDIWNAVVRPDGREAANEYLCLKCWHAKLRERLGLPAVVANPDDYIGTAGAT